MRRSCVECRSMNNAILLYKWKVKKSRLSSVCVWLRWPMIGLCDIYTYTAVDEHPLPRDKCYSIRLSTYVLLSTKGEWQWAACFIFIFFLSIWTLTSLRCKCLAFFFFLLPFMHVDVHIIFFPFIKYIILNKKIFVQIFFS